MPPEWLTFLAEASLTLGFLCALVIVVDLLTGHPQKMAVMNVTWPITALYFGPLALWAYYAFGRTKKQEGDAPEKPFWQSVFVGVTHCGGGCTVGDVIAEWGVFWLGWTIAGASLWPAYIADFLLAYLFGIAFQYFAIVPMRHLSPGEGLKAAVKADTLSLTAYEVGMFVWMGIVYFVLFHPHLKPTMPIYWFMMQIAMIIGFVSAYPMNWWLIKKGIKEAM